MNNKGQIVAVGTLLGLFIGVIVALSLFTGGITKGVGDVTNTITVANESLGATVVNGTAQYLTKYKSISGVVIYNETGDVEVGAGNYTVTNNVVYNGQEAVQIMPQASTGWKSIWKVSGTAQPLGYAPEASTRTMANLILILSALAVFSVIAAKIYQDGIGSFSK